MIYTNLYTPHEVALKLAAAAKAKRLHLNLSQHSLSERSGVSFGVIKKFELSGKISLESLLKLALALNCLEDFTQLFKETPPETLPSLEAVLETKTRKRGRL